MQFLKIPDSLPLTEFREMVGSRNVESILSQNSVPRTPNVGKALTALYNQVKSEEPTVNNQRKMGILNTLSSEADVFESAALQSEDGWKMLSKKNTMPKMLRIPDTITLPDSSNILGGTNTPISQIIYDRAMNYLSQNKPIDPIIFNTYSIQPSSQIVDTAKVDNPIQWFNIPWGKITLYSSLDGQSMDFPVFPEEYEDGYSANYDTMPDMLYQYEPWYIYKGSGPRSNPYEFKMHRDMWSGDHRDGKCNELIRFCEALCYPEYNGAAVNMPTATLYISGKPLITGIITAVKTTYSGPIGLDDFPLYVTLSLTFTEVASSPVNYTTMKNRGLIG